VRLDGFIFERLTCLNDDIEDEGVRRLAFALGRDTDPGVYPYRITMSVNAVPEPSLYLLMALGMAGIGWVPRRKT
jgi:hypothetical protein